MYDMYCDTVILLCTVILRSRVLRLVHVGYQYLVCAITPLGVSTGVNRSERHQTTAVS